MRIGAFGAVAAVNVALAATLFFLWSDDERYRWFEPQPIQPSLDEAVAVVKSEAADVSRFQETVERPLFAANRRRAPRSEAGSEVQVAADPLKDVRLLGLYGGAGRGGIVVNQGGKVQRVAFGEKIGEWTVQREEGRSAELVHRNGERRQIALTLNTTSPVAPVADAKAAESTGQAAASAPAAGARSTAAQRAAARRAAARGSAALSEDERRQRIRDLAARINARRAERGLPPIKEE